MTAAPTIDAMIADVIRREGGYTDHPDDRGGPTNMGITLATLSGWLDRRATALDVAALTEKEAQDIYRECYYRRPSINRLPPLIQPLVFDMSVNHGPGRAVIMLQQVLNAETAAQLSEDGKIGRKTCEAVEHAAARMRHWLVFALVNRRREFYGAIIADDPSQAVFEKGWLNRLAEFVPTAEQLSAT